MTFFSTELYSVKGLTQNNIKLLSFQLNNSVFFSVIPTTNGVLSENIEKLTLVFFTLKSHCGLDNYAVTRFRLFCY